jgi:large conductance mechanosensitive channel
MLKEFKEFAMKGNMVDLAVGFILGAAFGTVITSLVNDLLMPVVSSLFGTPDFSNLFTVLVDPANAAEINMQSLEAVREAGGVALAYGSFINALIAFLLVAFALFLVIKGINKAKKKQEEEEAAPAGPSQEDLLAEIRDLLKK